MPEDILPCAPVSNPDPLAHPATPKGAPLLRRVPLAHIRTEGFSASVDAYAVQQTAPHSSAACGALWLVSLLGQQQAVRALWARLLKGEIVTIAHLREHVGQESDESVFFPRSYRLPFGDYRWKFQSSLLPGGGYHGVLLPEIACAPAEGAEFLVLAREAEQLPALFYQALNRRSNLPLHRSWAGWLWQRSLDAGEVTRLASLGISAALCQPHEGKLQADLQAAVQQGLLPALLAAQEQNKAARPVLPVQGTARACA